MSAPDPDESERKHRPPPIWASKAKKIVPAAADPPILKRIKLPEKVTVAYLAEITGQDHPKIVEELKRLRLYLPYKRSLDIEAAALLLRKYGIGADREEG